MTIYVGKWSLLPEDWEGINGLDEKSEDEIRQEVSREVDLCEEDEFIAIYTPEEFEATFNHDDFEILTGITYWIKIF